MSKKVLVIGENCTDIFIYGKSRVPFHRKEQLGVHDDVFEIFETTTDPGMAGNVVKNLKHFGALVEFASNAEEFCKTRYVDTRRLWTQTAAAQRRLMYSNVLGKENPADLHTKH